ncbi:hypothetical protein [Aeromonas hydrophila]|uniref:hypothetical protein n=1 Tax=Aeromonas hydrophila TaxID=644 RepID=UPI002442D1AA|nr:hypothetical protein [Aeromonas hydrophila]
MHDLTLFGGNFSFLPAAPISGIDFDAMNPSDLAELIRLARIRGAGHRHGPRGAGNHGSFRE